MKFSSAELWACMVVAHSKPKLVTRSALRAIHGNQLRQFPCQPSTSAAAMLSDPRMNTAGYDSQTAIGVMTAIAHSQYERRGVVSLNSITVLLLCSHSTNRLSSTRATN